MRLKAYAVFQAEAKGYKDRGRAGGVGLKLLVNDYYTLAIFRDLETARAYMVDLIKHIKDGQKSGKRTADNLDPEKSLDFCLTKVEIVGSNAPMIKRGWQIPDHWRDEKTKPLNRIIGETNRLEKPDAGRVLFPDIAIQK